MVEYTNILKFAFFLLMISCFVLSILRIALVLSVPISDIHLPDDHFDDHFCLKKFNQYIKIKIS
jgi:hypothetical protein